jgi:hypothetical protein
MAKIVKMMATATIGYGRASRRLKKKLRICRPLLVARERDPGRKVPPPVRVGLIKRLAAGKHGRRNRWRVREDGTGH